MMKGTIHIFDCLGSFCWRIETIDKDVDLMCERMHASRTLAWEDARSTAARFGVELESGADKDRE